MVNQKSKQVPPDGAVVEWYGSSNGLSTGIVAGLRVRRVGRVSHHRPDGTLCVYDVDGIRAIVRPDACTVLAERAEAGWGNLA